ncbi:NAD(P)H-quinone oxidoreductase subunit M, chloroplastic [Coffea eugenioides]|uniref:NAD(P)H-quinone oxidoreductase subunit M, chloroplastic n=1 Tax=Coffea eugenioides TaxID=49369 RepID=UPI000F60688C|nr:NAD(P)H-quinone oxidoreductase subunit M, chloroplastic [Coffea eugenioides]XP_027148429.1 NAD(P)H-quinone oxidoreductase subunit M, chloroplastic [Coffea eugenioides]XP_027148430.1 NAD(P)H-quinone oxidoreductase subunit M, chloroplastic [Coffea eugenioides]XP_027148431.1 NAD(P)H-quinone oxidoreductase subunit M, chloroplastic [Coffea eugenioides]XP_027148432.1 NAD(P)H-quinone oxidoreductase subunit M, chloroplastic [Coffea eugenioides]
MILSAMAAAATSQMASTNLSMLHFKGWGKRDLRKRKVLTVSAQEVDVQEDMKVEKEEEKEKQKQQQTLKQPRPVEPQINVRSKNMVREYGGQWLSSATRHVRIYAAYVDPETSEFDQTQMDKLTLILDPTDEFVWTDDTCNQVYSYFQELVDHYEGAELTEYTLRLIGSDIEHFIRKLLYKGEIQYNMNANVLNFSMGKPRIGFNYKDGQIQDVNL